MKVLHVVPEIDEANGVYQVARDLAREQGGELTDCSDCSGVRLRNGGYDEVWVHGMWLPKEWKACWKVLRSARMFGCSDARPRLVRMTHGSLSPIYLEKQGKWKKKFVSPIERWLFKRTDRVVVTCEAEKAWCQRWGLRNRFEIQDLKRFFKLDEEFESQGRVREWRGHVLYLGRRHPLKGVQYLERAVKELRETPPSNSNLQLELRCVSNHFGEELEKDWAWCDVLCLPTLSENFGLVVAEALERGKRVITTDGAPAWRPPAAAGESEPQGRVREWRDRLVYLTGYRDGTDEERVRLLKAAILGLV